MITPQQKLQIMREARNDPNAAIAHIIDIVQSEADEKISEAVREKGSVFSTLDLEPAKDMAKAVAREEISAFKNKVDNTVKTVMQNLQDFSSETLSTVRSNIRELKKVGEDMRNEVDTSREDFDSRLNEAIKKSDTIFSSKINDSLSDFENGARDILNGFHLKLENMKGDTGSPGEPGKEGSPDTADQIAVKLNTLEEKVDWKVIRGLKNIIDNLNKAIRDKKGGGAAGGGGTGNFQHESKSVSAATTTVATTYNIAGRGLALWAYYQGQMLARGVGYTVSGKTITLLFTPQNSTFIDLIYIRT